jgi:ribosomal protein L40E
MRKTVCKKCGSKIIENDRNPNVHYSNPREICWRCEAEEEAPIGAWLQRKDGSYYRKRGGRHEQPIRQQN